MAPRQSVSGNVSARATEMPPRRPPQVSTAAAAHRRAPVQQIE
jgi:hypothetical protein